MYNAKYEDFDTVSMHKFLEADVNGDGIVNVQDSTAVVTEILKQSKGMLIPLWWFEIKEGEEKEK